MKLLAVDDEQLNLEILSDALSYEGFDVVTAHHGKEAMTLLEENPDVGLILLDRMMPEMDGMTTLKHLRADQRYASIPVIMQTAMADKDSIIEGIQAGVAHYLTKPYKREMLLAVVNAALENVERGKNSLSELRSYQNAIHRIRATDLTCKTIEEAQDIGQFIAQAFPNPERVAMGLTELIINGIEHGNLNIGGEQKAKWLEDGRFQEERARLLLAPEHKEKEVLIRFTREAGALSVIIKDSGKGFDWKKIVLDPMHAKDSTLGKGIAIARNVSFDEMQYNSAGNEVLCRVKLEAKNEK